MEERNAPQRNAGSKSRSSDQMVANFLDVTRKFTETLEDMRRQELMQSRRKASRKSLDFDEVHTSSRVRRQGTTPPRREMSDKRSFKRTKRAVGSCHSFFRKLSSCTAALTSALLQAIYPMMLSAGDWFESIARIKWRTWICTPL